MSLSLATKGILCPQQSLGLATKGVLCLSVEIGEIICGLHATISLPESFRGRISGEVSTVSALLGIQTGAHALLIDSNGNVIAQIGTAGLHSLIEVCG